MIRNSCDAGCLPDANITIAPNGAFKKCVTMCVFQAAGCQWYSTCGITDARVKRLSLNNFGFYPAFLGAYGILCDTFAYGTFFG